MQRLFALLLLIPLLGAGCAIPGDPSAVVDQPNVILIVTDDHRFDLFTAETMPTLYGLAEEGTNFTQAHVTTPLCCPSRASIFTGQYAHNHGVITNRAPNGGYTQFNDEETLPVWLQQAGYTTSLVGKYLNDFTTENNATVPPGWDDFHAIVEADGEDGNYYYDYSLLESGESGDLNLITYGRDDTDYSTDVLRDKALAFLMHQQDASRPFFLYFAPFAPHTPALVAPRHGGEKTVPRGSQVGDRMADSLLAVDEAVATFVDLLESQDQLDNTVIIFLGDNGYHLGEHGLTGKSTPYEESLHVPMMIWDGRQASSLSSSQLVLNIDIAPTILDLAGLEIPSLIDGRSVVPLMRGQEIAWRRDFVAESWDRGPASPFTALHTGDYIYIEFGSGEAALYDLVHDPREEKNLINDPAQAERIENLAGRLDDLRDCAGMICE